MAKYVLALQILVNLSGVGLFLYGWQFNNLIVMVIGGIIMVVDDFITVYSGAINIMGPVIAWGVVAFFLSPWWYSLFWSSLIFNIMGVPGSIITIWTFNERVRQMEEAKSNADLYNF